MSPKFREGSWDEDIWKSIAEYNEYGIADSWSGHVLDIGAHIGSFSYFALEKLGSRKVIAVEPDNGNFLILMDNMKGHIEAGSMKALNMACCNGHKASPESENWPNTGGALYSDSENGVDCISLDRLLEMTEAPVLLKIDCEGCEFEVLLKGPLPEKVRCIVGEYHSGTGHRVEELRVALESQGFVFSSHGKEQIGLFGAHRPM